MPTTVTLSNESVLSLAQNAIRPLKCEWVVGKAACGVTLGSWFLLLQHELRHCRAQRRQGSHGSAATCNLPRCNARFHSSISALEEHITQSHMSKVHFPCPVKGCNQTFIRSKVLSDHFSAYHPDLFGRIVHLPSELLRPLWNPFHPSFVNPAPIPTPHSQALVTVQLPRMLPKSLNGFHTISNSQSSPRKHLLRKEASHSLAAELDAPDIPDICMDTTQITIWKRPPELQKDMVRPQRMCKCEDHEKEPPCSIFYDAFARRLGYEEKNTNSPSAR